MSRARPAPFRGRHFADVIIILCVRWYLRYSLSYRHLKEIMAERGLAVDHVTIWRWVQHYAPLLNQALRRELRRPNGSWRVDETYIRLLGSGHTSTGQWIPVATRSTSCSSRSGI